MRFELEQVGADGLGSSPVSPGRDPTGPRVLTLPEAAALLRVSPRTIRRAVAARHLRCVRIGRRLLFDASDVSRFVAARKD